MEQIVFVVILFCFVNPVYLVGPLFFTPTYLTDNNGGYLNQYESIDGVIGQGYCIMGFFQNTDTSFTFIVNKYNSDGSLNSSSPRGTISWSYCSGNFWRTVIYKDGKCKAFYATSSGSSNYVNFYNGVPTDTDIHFPTDHHARVYRGIALTDGSYVVVGYYGGTTYAYIYKVNAANVGTYVTEMNVEYRTVVQYDNDTLYVTLWHQTYCNHYLKPISTSLALGSLFLTNYNSGYNLQDSILSSDRKIMIAGTKYSPYSVFISKTSTTGSNLWYTTFATSGTSNAPIVMMMMKDGSFLVADAHTISSKKRPFISSVSDSGAINWEATYTGYANNAIINGIQMLDDFLITLVGGTDDGTRARPFILKVTLACQPNYTLNALSTACIIGIFFTKDYFI